MNDLLFVACLSLLAFGLINAMLSCLTVLAARWLQFDCRPRARARRFLFVRIFPATASLLFVAVFFIPVLGVAEPGNADERVSLGMGMLAACAFLILATSLLRGTQSVWKTYRLSKSWLRGAFQLKLKAFPVPAYVIEAPFPVVALVGIFKQRLFVARSVLASCSAEEFDAILSHEAAHIRHRDNLLKIALRFLPDLLGRTELAGCLERGWAQASEEAADDDAVAAGRGLALASALFKLSRLARGRMPVVAVGIHGDGEVAHRLDRILRPECDMTPLARGKFDSWRFSLLLALPLLCASADVSGVHALTEALVRFLK